jgi:predicted ribosomally synthesized peptide with SipW-like signal peptide
MSSKRVKQYLMLLTAIGLIAIASGGGSGTFASFTAEVHNPGNTFATGSLYLHDSVTNLAECTSESAPNNSNTAEASPAGDACDTLITVSATNNANLAPNAYFDIAGANATGALTGTQDGTTIDLLDWNGGSTGLTFGIAANADVQFTDGLNSAICTVDASGASQGDIALTLGTCDLGAHSYGAGTVISSAGPYIAHLTLRNAGTIDGSDLKFAFDSDANVGGCLQTADGPGSATTLCDDSDFTITETNKSFAATIDYATGNTTGAQGCAYGSASGGGCLAGSQVLSDVLTQNPLSGPFTGTWNPVGLSSNGGSNNTRQTTGVDSTIGHASGSGPGTTPGVPGTGDTNPGGARYFLVEIWPGDLQNTDMGAAATFDIIWHMDQA